MWAGCRRSDARQTYSGGLLAVDMAPPADRASIPRRSAWTSRSPGPLVQDAGPPVKQPCQVSPIVPPSPPSGGYGVPEFCLATGGCAGFRLVEQEAAPPGPGFRVLTACRRGVRLAGFSAAELVRRMTGAEARYCCDITALS